MQITALSGRLLVVFCVYTWLVQLPLYYRIICIVNSFVSADRRATARTTTSLSHAAIRQKKGRSSAERGERPGWPRQHEYYAGAREIQLLGRQKLGQCGHGLAEWKLRVLEFKIQGCSEVVEGGGGRRARRKAATTSICPERSGWRIFAIEGTEDLWSWRTGMWSAQKCWRVRAAWATIQSNGFRVEHWRMLGESISLRPSW